jgi:hypothetical protein
LHGYRYTNGYGEPFSGRIGFRCNIGLCGSDDGADCQWCHDVLLVSGYRFELYYNSEPYFQRHDDPNLYGYWYNRRMYRYRRGYRYCESITDGRYYVS